jgi:fucose 4-O-acetylase-like acetyltransferase
MGAEQSGGTWRNVARGASILGIISTHVLNHDVVLGDHEAKFIAGLFFMPAFFVISGLGFRPLPFNRLLRRRLLSVIVPYVAFLVLVAILVAGRDFLIGGGSLPPLRDFLLGGAYLRGDFGAFWFLTAFFFTQLVYNLIASRYPDPADRRLVIIIGSMVVATAGARFILPNVGLPWSIDKLLYTVPLFWFGHLLQFEQEHARAIRSALVAISAMSLAAGLAGWRFLFNIKYGVTEPPVLSVLFGFVGARIALAVFRILPQAPLLPRLLSGLGRYSLVVLCLHQFVHFTLRRIGVETTWILILFAAIVPYMSHFVFARLPLGGLLFLGSPGAPKANRASDEPGPLTTLHAQTEHSAGTG